LLNLSRERLSNRLKLMRLDRTQVEELLGAMLAEEITPEFLEGIYQETEGNPFFIEEVCKALIEDGQLSRHGGQWHRPDDMNEMEIPQSIRLAIESRLEKLPTDTQETLRLAAVIGREFDFDTLLAASDRDEESVIISLEAAERVDIINEIRPSRGGLPASGEITFSFAHALIPTTIYDSTSSLRLRRLHGLVGAAIETRRPSDFESLAYHYAAAGQAGKAIDYAMRAAKKAKKVHAYDSSAKYLLRALSLFEADSDSVERLKLLEELADIHWLLGEDKLAISEYKQALDNLRMLTIVDPAAALRLNSKIVETAVRTVWLSDLQEFKADLNESKMSGIRLLEQVPPNEDSNRLLRALSREAWRNRSVPDWDAAENYARSAIDQAEQLDDLPLLSSALEALELTYNLRVLYEKMLAVTKRRLALVQEPDFDDPRERARVFNAYGRSLLRVGQYDEAIVYFQEAENFSEQIQDISQQVFAMRGKSEIWYHLDQWDNVLTNEAKWRGLQERFPNFMERVGPICFLVALSACVRGRRGELQEAEELRLESQQIMVAAEGGIERWDRYNYF
jgi:predicted ATPase